ncbi:hypothetical protein ACF0H5_013607 [Mactra antiquata]
MLFIHFLIVSSTFKVINGISLLRPSDLGQPDYLIHYHRDEVSGKHTRHIHYRPGLKRTQKPEPFSRKTGATSNKTVPVYKVPSGKLNHAEQEAQLALNLKTLLKGSSNRDTNLNRSSRNKTNTRTRNHMRKTTNSLPTGLQFLKKTKQSKGAGSMIKKTTVNTNTHLSLSDLLGGLNELTTESPNVNNNAPTEPTLDLAMLLGESAVSQQHPFHNHGDHTHDHSQPHVHPPHKFGEQLTNSLPDTSVRRNNDGKPRLANLFMGLFNQNKVKAEPRPTAHKESTTFSPRTIPSRSVYQKSTVHARPITKRGVIDTGGSNTFMDHVLKIRYRTTSPSPSEIVTKETRYRGLTKPNMIRTHYEPLSGIDLVDVRERNRNSQKIPAALKASLADSSKPVTSSELVHLKGIHLMFSNGTQDTNDKIPTIHLKALVKKNGKNIASKIRETATGSTTDTTTSSGPEILGNVLEKIVGTAVIRDGHLYLVVYPFGDNKSLEIQYNETVNKVQLPRNNPVPLSTISKLFSLTTPKPTTTTTAAPTIPATEENLLDLSSLLFGMDPLAFQPDTTNHQDAHAHDHTHGGHNDHHHHQHSHSHPFDGIKLSEVNDTTLQQVLKPIKRFMSPWNALNLSEVLPYPSKKRNATRSKEEEDVEIVTFVANATDPFHKIKVILESLSNASSSNSSGGVKEAKFNFEVQLQDNKATTTSSTKQSTTSAYTDNNSEEVRTVDITGKDISTVGYDSTEPLVRSTQIPKQTGTDYSMKELSASEGNVYSLDISSSRTTSNPTDMFSNSERATTASETRSFDVVTSTPQPSETQTIYDSTNTTPNSIFRTNNMESLRGTDVEPAALNNDIPYVAGSIAATNQFRPGVTPSYQPPRTTFTYYPNYTFSPSFRQRFRQTTQPRTRIVNSYSPNSVSSNTKTRTPQVTSLTRQHFQNSQPTEQLVSLADVLNDIKKLQLQHMEKMTKGKNTVDTTIGRAQQRLHAPILLEGPVFKETTTRYSDIPVSNHPHPFHTPKPTDNGQQWRHAQERADLRRALDAMLVLSVEDILADHTSLHGALVMPNRRDSSSSNKK